jgi:hypothetical protein
MRVQTRPALLLHVLAAAFIAPAPAAQTPDRVPLARMDAFFRALEGPPVGSPVFVEWRREAGRWVVSSGDFQ